MSNTITIREIISRRKAVLSEYGFESLFRNIERECGDAYCSDNQSLGQAYLKHCSEIRKSVSRFGAPLSPCTLNHYRRVWRMIFDYAESAGYITKSPEIRVKKAETIARDRHLSAQEAQNLRAAAADSPLSMLIAFSLHNPIRRSDVLECPSTAFSPGRQEVIIKESKTWDRTRRQTHLRNIPDGFTEYWSRIPSSCGLFCYVGRFGEYIKLTDYLLRVEWEKIRAAAGLKDYHFHDLNAEAVTYMVFDQGYSEAELQALGIKTIATQNIYKRRAAEDVPRRSEIKTVPFKLAATA